MAAEYWDRFNDADRVEFARYLQPLVIASRDQRFTRDEAMVYLLTLRDVPREILGEAIKRLITQGITWMPKPGDLKHACCDVVDARRAAATVQARAICDECPECLGTGWANTEGPNAVVRCDCHIRARQFVDAACLTLERPALPAHEDA